ERRLLVDGCDAARARGGGIEAIDRLPRDTQAAAVGLFSAGDDLDEGRFSCAVLPDEGVYLAGAELERDALERSHAGQWFGDGCRVDERNRHGITRRGCYRMLCPASADLLGFNRRTQSGHRST